MTRCNIARTSVADEKTKGGKNGDGAQVVIKKYANRRLYNTRTSAYVTLEDLAAMVREGTEFVVYDAKTNDDLTRQILTQIIFEEESRGEALLPVQFLRQLIGFYGGQMQGVLPSYLEMSLANFGRQQEQFASQMSRAFGTGSGASLMEEAAKANMAMFERAMQIFPAFGYSRTEPTPQAAGAESKDETPPAAAAPDALDEMRRQMDEMRAQIDRLAGGSKTK
ncbi:methyl-accepting chemotaxis protein [Brevundimonas intermedia]|uniref:Methyl-accepting chemotaxis protein n=1 Tax=Brevundimonas intermedia TaxID=74315 RepID=A0ABQ5T8V0_9CAUL|nr:methyl-accepting chemotaxis protein [Brevundimonas intermedia]